MQVALQQVAALISGVHVADATHGDAFLLQPRHFMSGQDAAVDAVPTIRFTDRLSKYLLRDSDVLIVAKGRAHRTWVYLGQPAPAVPGSAFVVIRILDKKKLLPAYLCWLLNHPDTQKKISAAAKGTALPALTQADVADIRIIIPALNIQKQIVRLAELQERKDALLRELEHLSHQQLQGRLLRIAKQDP